MSYASGGRGSTAAVMEESLPEELVALRDRLRGQSAAVREELAPLVDEALENARFRHRVMTVARDALEKFKLDLEMARFDLEATRREREALLDLVRRRLGDSRS